MSKLIKSDKPLFVSLMSRAFAKDPLFTHLFGDSVLDRTASSHVTAFVSFMFDKSFLLNEEVWGYFENESLLGAYIVEKPHESKLQNMKGLLLIGRLIPLLFQMSGQTLSLLNSYMRVTRSAAPPLTHHYLIMIAVQPEDQGKGIGKVLLKHLLNTVNKDTKSHGVALDTENKENINWYRKFGFTLSNETQIDNLPVYCMFHQK
ncbi:GNAT family N-acetyltransferase [Paenibacillus zanthoxyli]|uniref:GNAT family N-acetyltransferase n=1 Tax=Paenibacillus zanthoxyli TaxID=369399 RepID=UPI001E37F4D9|nr:GNAT family N-acetyltransferase [Paenibacillus zanthoxyli]